MKNLTLLLFFFSYCVSVVFNPTTADDFSSSILWLDEQRDDDVAHFQKILVGNKLIRVSRRLINELGSSPPPCILKCGRCTPCKPVRVAVPPGTSVKEEYYPEAWRCKCGNRLYMP